LASETGAVIYWQDAAASAARIAADGEALGRIGALLE